MNVLPHEKSKVGMPSDAPLHLVILSGVEELFYNVLNCGHSTEFTLAELFEIPRVNQPPI